MRPDCSSGLLLVRQSPLLGQEPQTPHRTWTRRWSPWVTRSLSPSPWTTPRIPGRLARLPQPEPFEVLEPGRFPPTAQGEDGPILPGPDPRGLRAGRLEIPSFKVELLDPRGAHHPAHQPFGIQVTQCRFGRRRVTSGNQRAPGDPLEPSGPPFLALCRSSWPGSAAYVFYRRPKRPGPGDNSRETTPAPPSGHLTR